MTNKKQTLIRLGLFLLITVFLTWIPHFICLYLFGYENWLTGPFGVIVTLTMFAPMLGNILTRLITKEGWRDSGLHFHFKGNIRWYIIAYLIPLLWWCIAVILINTAHGNWQLEGLAGHSFTELFPEFCGAAVFPLLYSSICCFGEEFGWRGYLNQKLSTLTGTAGAVVIGGIIWGLWHAPLVAMGFNFGSEHPVLGVILMCVSCIFINAVMMWLTEKTDSVFPAVLMHTVMDLGMDQFFIRYFVSGLSEETVSRVTEMQFGILIMIIPELIVGTVCFLLLLRGKRNTEQPAAQQ